MKLAIFVQRVNYLTMDQQRAVVQQEKQFLAGLGVTAGDEYLVETGCSTARRLAVQLELLGGSVKPFQLASVSGTMVRQQHHLYCALIGMADSAVYLQIDPDKPLLPIVTEVASAIGRTLTVFPMFSTKR